MNNEMYWYKDGELYTQRELLERELGRRVSDEEALEHVKRKDFINHFRAFCAKKREEIKK